MTAFPLIVSYYTKDTMYQLDAKGLIESCEKWGLEHHVEAIDSFGSWELNCAYKPFFLLSKLQEFKRPIFWVDVDAAFLRKPAHLEEFSADLAARINHACAADHPSKVMSGSIYVNNTPQAASLLKLWVTECYQALTSPERAGEYWDQMGLRDAIFSDKHKANVVDLPRAYIAVDGHPLDKQEILEPIIMHYQASRRYKKMINEK